MTEVTIPTRAWNSTPVPRHGTGFLVPSGCWGLLTSGRLGLKLYAMRLLPRLPTLGYGGDYNPEQWDESVWADDVALMRTAGVTLVTVGVFGWAALEPAEGRYEFGWLDRVLELLRRNEIAVDLATATASPPPWFPHRYPKSLPVDTDGRRLWYGSRQSFCASSPEYRDVALHLV